jgi:hypothetical protein
LSRPVVFAFTGDQHCGSTVALCPPTIKLDDGGFYSASRAQQWLWERWLTFWARVDAVRTLHDADLYLGFNGDMTDGDHHGTTQILSGNSVSQAAVVNAALAIPLKLSPNKIWVIRGTEAHVGKSASNEEKIADGLRRNGDPIVIDEATETSSHWHARIEIDGVRLDLAHHGRMGQRPWTKPNVVANLAAEIFYNHAANGIPHPHLAIRSHMHQFVDTHDIHPVRVIQMPAWQLATAFIHRIAPGAIADVGGIIVVIKDGSFFVEPIIYHPAPPAVWRQS